MAKWVDDGYSYGRGYNRYDDNEIDDYEMEEVFDENLSVDHWSDSQGEKVSFGKIILMEPEIVADQALQTGDPDDKEFEGYTGNAGMTLECWYHKLVTPYQVAATARN